MRVALLREITLADSSNVGPQLSPLQCPECGSRLHPVDGQLKSAGCFEDCLRRCEPCGVGFSNGRSEQTRIYRNPVHNVPDEVRTCAKETIFEALNEQHRPDKYVKFGFSTSEDALTWTVFTFLRKSGQLGKALRKNVAEVAEEKVAGADEDKEPELLLWGVPQPRESHQGALIRERLIDILDRIGESPMRRSEPDVIADFGPQGLVEIEVKYGARNDQQDFGAKHEKYLAGIDAFEDHQAIRESRLYELARNWRIGIELANGAPFTLLNLVVRNRDATQIEKFRSGLNEAKGQFRVLTWAELVGQIEAPTWLTNYLNDKFASVHKSRRAVCL